MLAMLVMIQSIAALADAHRYESGICDSDRHVELAHDTLCDNTAPELELLAPDHAAQDCEHCCHCHGSAVAALAHQLPLLSHSYVPAPSPAVGKMPSRLCERHIRPPIA